MRATWLLGGTGALLASSAVFASPFTFQLVVDDQSTLPGGLVYEGPNLLVAGNGGTVATISAASGELYVMTHNGGATTLLTGVDDGFSAFSELAFSPNGTVSFQTNNPSSEFRLYQSPASGGGITRVDAAGTNIDNSNIFDDSHYQVNASGVVVYKYRNAGVQSFSTAVGNTTINTVAEGDLYGVKNFNLPVSGRYRRQAITGNGSVVFYAEDATTSDPAIYRLDSGGSLSTIPLSGITAGSRVIGASDNAVLYTTLTGPGPIQTSNLTLQIDSSSAVTLASYDDDAIGSRVTNAVMTQQNRVAYFDPGPSANTASVGYYDTTLGDVTIIAEGGALTDDQANGYTVKRISVDEFSRTTNPMVNDNGIVVFDAVLTPDAANNTDVYALLMWDTETQQVKIVVKTDGGGTYSDDFGGGKVTGLLFDLATNQAGEVLKDALSEDNYLAFGLTYNDGSLDHIGVAVVQVPEPAAASVLGAIAAGALLRRRRGR